MAEKYDTICFICNANYKQVQTLLGSKTTWLALEAERLFRLVFYWFIDVQHVFEPFDSIPWGIFWLWSTSLFGSASFYIRHMEAGKSLWEYQVPFLKKQYGNYSNLLIRERANKLFECINKTSTVLLWIFFIHLGLRNFPGIQEPHSNVYTWVLTTDYGHSKAKFLILCGPNKYLVCGYKGLVFCRNNGW